MRELAVEITPPFEDELYLRLAESEDPEVRARLALAWAVDEELLDDLLFRLADDPDSGVRAAVDDRLAQFEEAGARHPRVLRKRLRSGEVKDTKEVVEMFAVDKGIESSSLVAGVVEGLF